MAWTTSRSSGLGQTNHSGRECGQDRVEVRAEPGDLLAVDIGDREEVAVRGRPDRLRHVSEIEATAAERAVPEDGRACRRRSRTRRPRRQTTAEGLKRRRAARRGRATARRARPRSPAPDRPRGRPRRSQRQLGLAGQATHSRGQRLGVAGRDEQRALAVTQQLARRRRVGGDQGRAAGESLERLVRDHAAAFVDVPKTPSAHPARWISSGSRS